MIRNTRKNKNIIVLVLAACMILGCFRTVKADTVEQLELQKKAVEEEKKKTERELGNIESDIEDISEEKAALEEELEELDQLLVNLLLEVNLLQSDIEDKKIEIAQAEEWYTMTVARVKSQEEAMALRIKFMYEKGNQSYIEVLLESKSMADAVNKVVYTEKLYAYDRMMLEAYMMAKQDVADIQEELAVDLSELEEMEKDLEVQQQELNALIAEKQATVEGFSAQLNEARARASEYQIKIKQQSDALKQINKKEQDKIAEEAKKKAEALAKKKAEEAAKKKAEEDAKNLAKTGEAAELENAEIPVADAGTVETPTETVSTNPAGDDGTGPATSGTTVTATGSGLGTEIANYGLQFVGNPYVSGGTSLTNGADCSGFTQAVYAHFGISIPRSSYSQSTGGVEVPLSDMAPGDIIYYGGHVAIYIGNNQIVHASTPSTGIKVSSASYRSIITVRRYY